MKFARTLIVAAMTATALVTSGCALIRGQETTGEYVDDKVIVTKIKAKMIEDKIVDAAAINVDSLKGTVALSGFAKSSTEKAQAEYIARNTSGVREVRNNLIVRP